LAAARALTERALLNSKEVNDYKIAVSFAAAADG
jgi:hypothetical protein